MKIKKITLIVLLILAVLFFTCQILKDMWAQNIAANGKLSELSDVLGRGYNVNKVSMCNSLFKSAILSLSEHASSEETIDKIKLLISAGADVNQKDCQFTPLMYLILAPDFAMEHGEELLRRTKENLSSDGFCSYNVVSKPCREITEEERYKIKEHVIDIIRFRVSMLAKEQIEIMGLLLKAGADINGKVYMDRIPLHLAASMPNEYGTEVLKYMLDNGAAVNQPDVDGNTALFFAHAANNPKAVKLLIEYGADTSIRNKKGNDYQSFHYTRRRGSAY